VSSRNAARPTSVVTGESTAVSEQVGTLLDTSHTPAPNISQANFEQLAERQMLQAAKRRAERAALETQQAETKQFRVWKS
jgi:hypothetical protein